MYVTRRLLRSTMPSEPTDEKKETPFVPPSTPKRRAAVRASAKISDGSGARGRAAKASPSQAENGGDGKNKSRTLKKKEKKQEVKEEDPALDSTTLHGHQLMIDVHYRGEQYAEARILDLDVDKELIFVHYMGWNARFDAWVPLEEVAAHGSHSGAAKKKGASWDGETPLFAPEEEVAALKKAGKGKPKTSKTQKKRTELSPKARQAARKALRSASSDRKKHSDETVETEVVQPPAKRSVRKSPKNAKTAKKQPAKSPRAGKKVSAKAGGQRTSGRRTPRRVQVVVGTTDEDSERKNDSETADLVLEVEIQGHDSSNEEVEEEDAQKESPGRAKKRANSKSKARGKVAKEVSGESKRKRNVNEADVDESTKTTGAKRSPAKKPKKGSAAGKAASKPAAAAKPLPPQPGRGGLGSATREKLAAIFRMRVQQRQEMEQMNANQSSFQQSLQEEAAEEPEAAADTDTDAGSTRAQAAEVESTNTALANAELAAAEEYQRQLQQYYYHQQVMLANSLSMSVSSCEDPSTIPLQGGIMDPRIIQDRLTALEERRRQQAHVQAYYHQLMLTRERNVRALAANQAFMTASAAVWEQQLRETQSEDGTSSVTSWKDVTDAHGATDKDSPGTDTGSLKGESKGKAAGVESSGDAESNKGDNNTTKESETSSAAVTALESASNGVTSPDTVEKAADGSASTKTSPTKCDPAADAPAENVLYEFVL